MTKTLALSLFFVAAVARADAPASAPKPPSSEDALVAHVAEAKWAAPKLTEIPPGLLGAPIAVDPASGAPIGYAKFPAGYVFPMHFHSFNEYTVVISGKLTFTVNGKSSELVPGSYIVIPAKAPHSATCAPGAECVAVTRRGGPADYHFVK